MGIELETLPVSTEELSSQDPLGSLVKRLGPFIIINSRSSQNVCQVNANGCQSTPPGLPRRVNTINRINGTIARSRILTSGKSKDHLQGGSQ